MSHIELEVKEYIRELVYDIRNKTHITARVKLSDGNSAAVGDMQASDSAADTNELLRGIQDASARLHSFLADWLVKIDTSYSDDILMSWDESETVASFLRFKFRLPSNFNTEAAPSIAEGVHGFIVGSCLSTWYGMNKPDEVKTWLAHADGCMLSLRKALSRRSPPVRPSGGVSRFDGLTIVTDRDSRYDVSFIDSV